MQLANDSREYCYGSTDFVTAEGRLHRECESSGSASWWLSSDRLAYPPLPPPGRWRRAKTSRFVSAMDKFSISQRFSSFYATYCDCQPAPTRLSLRSACSWRTAYRGYFFWSKSVVLLLLINALFSTALYGVTAEILKIIIGAEFALTRNLVMHGVTQILFPIAGHIADTYAGKHNMLRFSLWVAWFGFAILAMSFSLDTLNQEIETFNRYAVLPVTFAMLSTSYVCFVSTVLPFGMDQLQGASHVHFRSFFCWWYWTLNVGVIIVNAPQYCRAEVEVSIMIQAGIGVVCITAALVLDALCKEWFTIEPKRSTNNPLSQIAKVLRGAASTTKNVQNIPSVVRHELNLGRLNRLDLIKDRYGGTFGTEQVEDVRMFLRILLVLLTIGFSVLSYSGVSVTMSRSFHFACMQSLHTCACTSIYTHFLSIYCIQVFGAVGFMVSHMTGTLFSIDLHTRFCEVQLNLDDGINAIVLLTFIPLLDLLLVPFLRNSNPTILKRLGFGAALASVSLVSLCLMEAIGTHQQSEEGGVCMFDTSKDGMGQLEMDAYWTLLPIVTVTLAEVFIYIPCKCTFMYSIAVWCLSPCML